MVTLDRQDTPRLRQFGFDGRADYIQSGLRRGFKPEDQCRLCVRRPNQAPSILEYRPNAIDGHQFPHAEIGRPDRLAGIEIGG